MNSDPRHDSLREPMIDSAPVHLMFLVPGLRTMLTEVLHILDKPAIQQELQATCERLQKIAKSLLFVGESSLALFFQAIAVALEDDADGSRHADDVKAACKAALRYLDDVDDGIASHPLTLFSAYKALLAVCGQEKIHPADLAFSWRIDVADLEVPFDAAVLSEVVQSKVMQSEEGADIADVGACRTAFERALREYQQVADTPTQMLHLSHMAQLTGQVARSCDDKIGDFWRAIAGAITVLASTEISVDQYAKKFLGQVNLQLRRLAGGAIDGDTRLLREALFFIALAPEDNASASAIKSANGLPHLRQRDYQESRYAVVDSAHDAVLPNHPRSVVLSELSTALARAEQFLEDSFNGVHAPAEAARVMRELAATAARLKLDQPARLLYADATAIDKLSETTESMCVDVAAVENAIHNLAALSLSLPLMRHGDDMYYAGREAPMVDREVLVAATEIAAGDETGKKAEVVDAAKDDGDGEEEKEKDNDEDDEELDLELLDIFLMEADEIIGNVDKALLASRDAPKDMAHITVIRRGFHTLKGSGRMVGLDRLGEAAMAVEGFLNTWLTHAMPGSAADYALLDVARGEMALWIDEIRTQGKSARRPDDLISAVRDSVVQNSAIQQSIRTVQATESPEQQTIHIGSMVMPVRLHQIYCDESRALLAVILGQLQQWRSSPSAVIAPELLRATHSLKSSAASVQFTALQAVAQPLDEIMQFVENYPALLDADVCDVLLSLVLQLQRMQQSFSAAQIPPARDDLRKQLEELLAQLEVRRGEMEQISGLTEVYADDIDPELLEIFLEEGRDLLPQIGASLHKLQKSPDDDALIRYVLRPLHTIKGSARMAGAMYLGQHMHELESRISEIVRDGMPSSAQIDDLLARYDRGLQLFEALQAPTPLVKPALTEPVETIAESPRMPVVGESIPLTDADLGKGVSNTPLVRIRAGILDSLLNQAGEISISRSGLESDVNILRQHLADLSSNVTRLSTQLREVEIQAEIQITASNLRQPQNQHFDPLEFDRFTHLQELTRMLAESVNDVSSLQKNLLEAVDHTQNGLAQQARLTRDMQQELMRARMVQFRDVEERLHRLVRQMAKETGKEILLEIAGNTVELDRSILEKMVGPFEHLLRNAAAHGIESAEQRRAAGKDVVGHLLLEVRQEGNEVMIRLSDDGQGLDLARIRDKAVRLGLIDAARHLSDMELSRIIFQPGFSTSADVTAIAGRGVGMDVVRSEVASLGGRISIDSVAEKGATFIIHLPLSLAITQVVLLELGAQTYAIPSLLVEQVLQLKSADQAQVFRDGTLDWQGRKLQVHYLSALLGEDAGVPLQQTLSILVVKSGHDFLAILVDRIIANREVVTKNMGPQLAHMIGVVGATVLGSGSIVLILNPIQLAQYQGYQKILRCVDQTEAQHGVSRQTILVVDDSLTVRRVMHRLLTREGYDVVLATDGVDALQQLRGIRPDIVLLDIEMPRMDGFDLARHIRDMESMAGLPIIMITSRTAAKHRERAMELGVNAYLGKPYQDEVLLNLIHGLIPKHEGGALPAYQVDEVLFTASEQVQEQDLKASDPDK